MNNMLMMDFTNCYNPSFLFLTKNENNELCFATTLLHLHQINTNHRGISQNLRCMITFDVAD